MACDNFKLDLKGKQFNACLNCGFLKSEHQALELRCHDIATPHGKASAKTSPSVAAAASPKGTRRLTLNFPSFSGTRSGTMKAREQKWQNATGVYGAQEGEGSGVTAAQDGGAGDSEKKSPPLTNVTPSTKNEKYCSGR